MYRCYRLAHGRPRHDDAVKEAPYCLVCRRSSAGAWRKHLYSRTHQEAAHGFLLFEGHRLAALARDANAVPVAACASSWRCVFCAVAVPRADALAHVGTKRHQRRVGGFCRRYRCDADRQMRTQLWLQTMQPSRELETVASNTSDQDNPLHQEGKIHSQVKDATSERVAAFLSSATSRLQEVETERRRRQVDECFATATCTAAASQQQRQDEEVLFGPLMDHALAGDCKTVVSADGVVQNPVGRHEGRRVWGGGIVKLRKTECMLWPIDRLVKEEQREQSAETQQTETSGHVLTHRVTELARSRGCSSIASVSWGASVGNIHSAAVPPWMVQTEEEYKKCNQRDQGAPVRGMVISQQQQSKGLTEAKRRDIFAVLESKSECGPNWLPNFGGVWEEGPRSKTKQAFRRAGNVGNNVSARDEAGKLKCSPSNVPRQTLTARITPAISQKPLRLPIRQPAARQQSVVEVKQEVRTASARETVDSDESSACALDAKKQLLMAQKERLRARMAARKR
ncbi:unnamed protein product [Hyaloperonospora brassicae]|uniref:U1-type domain-containing protein n=1 Tax=Hyaloperonospora brassicae TaxID=162125 RepID=A0AAV0TA04_HYABA|nr:unnamed protein product [Hyaloperonospora brassicae]